MIYIEKLHLFSCVFMVGVIWVVQIVQYPNFSLVTNENFKSYHSKYSDRISFVVAPVMLLELITAYWLFYEYGKVYLYHFAVIALIFILTATVSVPLHNKLSSGKDDQTISKLIKSNWLRTVLWTSKLCVLYVDGYL